MSPWLPPVFHSFQPLFQLLDCFRDEKKKKKVCGHVHFDEGNYHGIFVGDK